MMAIIQVQAWYVGKSYEGYLPKTKRTAVNRNTGKTDKKEDHYYWNSHWANKWVDDQPSGSYQLTRDVMGDEYDAFNFDYNELLTPWSNPSTYVDGTTNISIQLYNQTGNNITVKAFTTQDSANSLPPSKPQNLKVSNVNGHPKLTWTHNSEPDRTIYEVYRKENNNSWNYIGSEATRNYFVDNAVNANVLSDTYYYKIRVKDTQDKFSVYSNEASIKGLMAKYAEEQEISSIEIPTEYSIAQNYPNPFNPSTTITYQIPQNGYVTLKVYNSLGQEVSELVNRYLGAGSYTATFDATNSPSGIYFYKLQSGNFTKVNKMMLLK